MDSGQDHFTDSFRSHCLNLLEDLAGSPAPDPSSGIGNDAVRTELIAAVLYFDIGPCVAGVLELHILIVRPVRQVGHGPAAQGAPFKASAFCAMCFAGCALLISAYPCQELIQKFRDLRFLIITNGQIDGMSVCEDSMRAVMVSMSSDARSGRA